ncbi:SDR family NAD(P)-dependent oxidoreductase [bacterium SCSIO 12741]|nr:SDR family NAD(P)-dependent oxidoreductase [bacterium SCSIO 12741]
MNLYYITGTSRGIGKALAEELLREETNVVIGLGRSASLSNANYSHKVIDLSNLSEVMRFRFGEHLKADRVCLINNAGTLGEIKPVGKMNNDELIRAYNVNLIAPTILMNNFVKTYSDKSETDKLILNISSGAAQSAYDGWSVYCSSKAGLTMFGDVILAENKVHPESGLRILSVAPGVIETEMQQQIRSSSEEDFSTIDRFVELKEGGHLKSTQQTALELIQLMENLPEEGDTSFMDLRS